MPYFTPSRTTSSCYVGLRSLVDTDKERHLNHQGFNWQIGASNAVTVRRGYTQSHAAGTTNNIPGRCTNNNRHRHSLKIWVERGAQRGNETHRGKERELETQQSHLISRVSRWAVPKGDDLRGTPSRQPIIRGRVDGTDRAFRSRRQTSRLVSAGYSNGSLLVERLTDWPTKGSISASITTT